MSPMRHGARAGRCCAGDQDQHPLTFLQGDRRHAGNPSDGVIARRQIAEVLVHSLTSASAPGKSFEPLDQEPQRVRDDLAKHAARA